MRTRPTVIAVAQMISQFLVSYSIGKLAFVFGWSLCGWDQDAFGCSDGTEQGSDCVVTRGCGVGEFQFEQ